MRSAAAPYRGLRIGRDDASAQPADRAWRQARSAHRRRLGRASRARAGSGRAAARDRVGYRDGVLQRARRTAQGADLRRADRRARSPDAAVAAAGRCRRLVAGGDRRARRSPPISCAPSASAHARRWPSRAASWPSLMGADVPDFGEAVGDLGRVGTPPPFASVVRGLDSHPQLVRWTAVRAQRDAELLSARLKPIPDVRVERRLAALSRHRRQCRAPQRVGAASGLGSESRRHHGGAGGARQGGGRTRRARAALILTLARAYETLQRRAARDRAAAALGPAAMSRQTVEAIESGYAQGRFTLARSARRRRTPRPRPRCASRKRW